MCCPSSSSGTRRPRKTKRTAWRRSSTRSWRASRPRTTRRCRPTTTPSPPSRGRSPTGRAPTTSTSSSTRWPRTPRRATTPSSRTRCADARTPGVAEARRYPGCVFEHLVDLETELEKLESQLPELYASGDQAAARDAGRRHAELKPVVDAYREYRRTEADVADARELLAAETDTEMREYLQGDLAEREARLAELEATLKELLVPRDPNDGKNVIMEIRGAEGGDEANLWAGDLFEMYRRYAELRGWGLEVLSRQPSEMGGFRDITFVVKGRDAWARLKHEAGPHRVQRVPTTGGQGGGQHRAAAEAAWPQRTRRRT